MGGANIVDGAEDHMHEAIYRFEGPNRLETEWRMYSEGKISFAATFDLVRRRTF